MPLHTGTEESVKYNQAANSSSSGREETTRTGNQSSAQEAETRSDGNGLAERTRESADRESSSGKSESATRQTAATRNGSERTAETTRALTATSTQVTRLKDGANIAFQVAFAVPVRSIVPGLGG